MFCVDGGAFSPLFFSMYLYYEHVEYTCDGLLLVHKKQKYLIVAF